MFPIFSILPRFRAKVGAACLVLAAALGLGRLFWDSAAAHAYAGIAARVAGLRRIGRPDEALALIGSQARRFPASSLAGALLRIEDGVVREMVEAARRDLRRAAVLDGEAKAGAAFRAYAEMEKSSGVPAVRTFARRSMDRITARREAAEDRILEARRREDSGDPVGAHEEIRRIARDHAGSSAAGDLRIPVFVEVEPGPGWIQDASGARISAPAWIRWPLRPGARLRVGCRGFRTEAVDDLLPNRDPPWRAAIGLVPEAIWSLPLDGGSAAAADPGEEDRAYILSPGPVLRSLRVLPKAKRGRILWAVPVAGTGEGLDPGEAGIIAGEEAVLVLGPKGSAAFRPETGEPIPRGSGEAGAIEAALSGIPPGEAGRRGALRRGVLTVLDREGRLWRHEPAGDHPSTAFPCGDGLDRLEADRSILVLTGRGGIVALRDARTGEERGRRVLPLPPEAGDVEEILLQADRPGLEGPFILRGRRDGEEVVVSADGEGCPRWTWATGSRLPLSMRVVRTPGFRSRLLLSAPGWGTRMVEMP